nr:SpoVG family protein [uncultured Oscillibacter sp.]
MSSEATKTERDQTIKLDVSAKVYPTKDPKQEKGSVLAFASADIGGCFAVTGIRIVEGKEGPFVAMPSQFGKDKQHHDICFPTTSAMREALNTVVMDAYRDVLEQQAARAAQAVERLSERSAKPSLRGALQNAMKDVATRPPQEGQRTMEQGAR